MPQDFDRASKVFKLFYGINLESKEHALRGWNWGKGEFGKAELAFNVQNRPAFEIPYTEISNTNLAGKNEVAIEFSLPAGGSETGTNGHLGGARSKGRKAGAARDQLVEMRFYIPGTATKKEQDEEGEDKSVEGSDAEEQNAANLFYETLMDKAEIGEVAGDTVATFLDALHLTPRCVRETATSLKRRLADRILEVVLTSICMRAPSGCVVRRMTTKFLMTTSRSLCCFQNRTIFIC